MTHIQESASQRLADLLTAATGMSWAVDADASGGECVIVHSDAVTWARTPMVYRDEWREVRVNPSHPDRSERRNLGKYTGKGWQEGIVAEIVHIFGSAEKKP